MSFENKIDDKHEIPTQLRFDPVLYGEEGAKELSNLKSRWKEIEECRKSGSEPRKTEKISAFGLESYYHLGTKGNFSEVRSKMPEETFIDSEVCGPACGRHLSRMIKVKQEASDFPLSNIHPVLENGNRGEGSPNNSESLLPTTGLDWRGNKNSLTRYDTDFMECIEKLASPTVETPNNEVLQRDTVLRLRMSNIGPRSELTTPAEAGEAQLKSSHDDSQKKKLTVKEHFLGRIFTAEPGCKNIEAKERKSISNKKCYKTTTLTTL